MTAALTYSKSADEALLAEMTTLSGVANLLGVEADSENTNAQRVVWIPLKWTTGKLAVQPVDGHGVREHGRRYNVAMYADNYDALIVLFHAVYRALDTKLTLQGFDFGEGEPKGGSGGWGIVVPVTLKGPIYVEVYGSVVVTKLAQTMGVTLEGDPSPAEALQ